MEFGVFGINLSLSLGEEVDLGLLVGVPGSRANETLVLETSDDIFVLPADLRAESREDGVRATRAEADSAEGLGKDNALDLVVRRRDTFEDLQAVESGSTTGSLVGEHTADGTPQDLRWGTEVEGTGARVGVLPLVEESMIFDAVAKRGARNADALGTDGNNLLAVQELLGDDGSQTSKHVILTINDDSLKEKQNE